MAGTGCAWKGTILTFGGTVAGLLSCRDNETGEQLDVTDAASDRKEYEAGYSDAEVTYQVKGAVAPPIGTTAELSILWGRTGETVSYGPYTVVGCSRSGDRGSIVTTDVTLKPAIAAAGGGS